MIRVRMTRKVGTFAKGAEYAFDERSAGVLVDRGDAERVDGVAEAGEFDPSAHDVDGVNEHLAGASPAERHRVLALERAGKARKGVLEA